VRQNPIQRTVSLFICVCIALCTIVAHNIAQNRPDSFPPYPPANHHSSNDVYLTEGGRCSARDRPQGCKNRSLPLPCRTCCFLSALTLLVRRQEEHPACEKFKWWAAGVVVCLKRGADNLRMVQMMPLPPDHLFIKIRIGLSFLVLAYPGCPRIRGHFIMRVSVLQTWF